MHSISRGVVLAWTLLLVPRTAGAAVTDASGDGGLLPVPAIQTAVTHHVARVGNHLLSYVATASTIVLTDAKDQPTASVFYVAYTAEGLGPSSRRPLTFAYNGGPGGSSALIHLGAFGPRMVVTVNAATTPPPYDIVDNTESLLDSTDLVFVDAVGTGFSRLAGHGTAKDFYGVTQDGAAFEQFIRRYITVNDRWNSPKYLAGESYGTTRSAVLANLLQQDGISVSGVVLMSTVLNFATIIPQLGNDDPYWLYLPSEAAVAAYHRRIDPAPTDLGTFLSEARAFARGPLLTALAKGADLPIPERDDVARRLHAYTGLPVEYLERAQLRVEPGRFEKELLHNSSETIGRFDGRFRAFDIDPLSDTADADPSSDAVFGAFTAAFNRYVRNELHYRTDAAYNFLSGDVNQHWQWHRGERGSPSATNVASDLRDALTSNPYLRVFSANGIYDLATPFFATEYSLTHLRLNPALQSHISYGYYPAGHMIYLNAAAHAQLKADLDRFYAPAMAR